MFFDAEALVKSFNKFSETNNVNASASLISGKIHYTLGELKRSDAVNIKLEAHGRTFYFACFPAGDLRGGSFELDWKMTEDTDASLRSLLASFLRAIFWQNGNVINPRFEATPKPRLRRNVAVVENQNLALQRAPRPQASNNRKV